MTSRRRLLELARCAAFLTFAFLWIDNQNERWRLEDTKADPDGQPLRSEPAS